MCLEMRCQHAVQVMESREREWICSLSGRILGGAVEQGGGRGWTGRSVGSADPDLLSGGMSTRAWRCRKDAYQSSRAAYTRAGEYSLDEVRTVHSNRAKPRKTAQNHPHARARTEHDNSGTRGGSESS